MGFKKLRLCKITGTGADGYPTYGNSFLKLQDPGTDEELNSVDITVSDDIKSFEIKADDKVRTKEVVRGYNITVNVRNVDKNAACEVFGYELDGNNNLIEVVNNAAEQRFGVFFQSENSRGEEFQKYLYDVQFGKPKFSAKTKTGEDEENMELTGYGRIITESNGSEVKAVTVYKGNNGWVSTEPSSMYKRTAASQA